jgi:hypothetical protein
LEEDELNDLFDKKCDKMKEEARVKIQREEKKVKDKGKLVSAKKDEKRRKMTAERLRVEEEKVNEMIKKERKR